MGVAGLRALVATGVRVGVVSNADGSVAQRLSQQEVLQVGPGLGVEVDEGKIRNASHD